MRFSLFITTVVLSVTVAAEKHRLCCCSGPNYYNTATTCLETISNNVVADSEGRFVTSPIVYFWSADVPIDGAGWVYVFSLFYEISFFISTFLLYILVNEMTCCDE